MVKLCFSFLLLSAALAISGCGGVKIPLQASEMSSGNVSCENHAFSGVVLLSEDNGVLVDLALIRAYTCGVAGHINRDAGRTRTVPVDCARYRARGGRVNMEVWLLGCG